MRIQIGVATALGLTLLGCGGSGSTGPESARSALETPTPRPGTVVSADGVEIAYTAHRIGRPNLVLVHGWMCDQTYWEPQVAALAERAGVVTVDLAGHGASAANRESWTISSLGGDVAAVITKLQLDDVIVVGHSMGGLVALDVAGRLPEAVIGVISVDELHDADAERTSAEMDEFMRALREEFQPTCDDFVRSNFFVNGTDPAFVDGVAADMCSGPGAVGAALIQAYVDYDLAQAFADTKVPIRAINADLWPTDVAGNQELADFETILFEGHGHFLMQEAAEDLNKAILETSREILSSP
jgi:pimeloyl-ACP methyl ester carboxylesterase